MRAVDRSASWGNSVNDLRVGESQLPSADRKEALAQALWCLATKTSLRLLLFCLGSPFSLLCASLLLPRTVSSIQSKTKQQYSMRGVTTSQFQQYGPSLGFDVSLTGKRCNSPLAAAYDDCVRPARCLCRSSGSEWVSVETTPQRPKILKPPPNHPPQNKPSNRNQASASRSHRFPIAPPIPAHVSSPDSAATCPQIIRHSRSSPAGCTPPEWVPACLPRYPGPAKRVFSLVVVSKSDSSLPKAHCFRAASDVPRHAFQRP